MESPDIPIIRKAFLAALTQIKLPPKAEELQDYQNLQTSLQEITQNTPLDSEKLDDLATNNPLLSENYSQAYQYLLNSDGTRNKEPLPEINSNPQADILPSLPTLENTIEVLDTAPETKITTIFAQISQAIEQDIIKRAQAAIIQMFGGIGNL